MKGLICIWCGRGREAGEFKGNVHRRCEGLVDKWLLVCVRHSDHPKKYIDRIEAREAPMREARARSAQAALPPVPELPLAVARERDHAADIAELKSGVDGLEQRLDQILRALSERGRS